MKKTLSIILAVAMALCLCVPVMAAGSHTVTIINGMDGSVAETFTVADGEDFVFSISCAAPADMGPVADGELGSGVTTTEGTITYSNITTGGPNAYPTAETVTISGITKDATVTVTPNPDEVGSEFPTITEGELAGGASGEASGEASGDASSDEPYPMFEEYKDYLYETMMQDAFWQGNEESLVAALEAAETPDDESIQNFTGSGDVDQAPAGVVFPMTYDVWYAENGASGEPYPMFEEYKDYLYETLMQDAFWQGNEESLVAALEAAETPDDESIQNFTGSGDVDQAPAGVVFPMTYDVWYAENGSAGGEAMSVEDAYVEYIHEFLLAELEINSSMTIEQIEDEFMPLVEAGDYVSFPADMLYSGMLNSGAAMTFEEFAAQY